MFHVYFPKAIKPASLLCSTDPKILLGFRVSTGFGLLGNFATKLHSRNVLAIPARIDLSSTGVKYCTCSYRSAVLTIDEAQHGEAELLFDYQLYTTSGEGWIAEVTVWWDRDRHALDKTITFSAATRSADESRQPPNFPLPSARFLFALHVANANAKRHIARAAVTKNEPVDQLTWVHTPQAEPRQ